MALSWGKRGLFLEAFFYLSVSRLLIFFFSFKYVAKNLGEPMKESLQEASEEKLFLSKNIGRMVKKASSYSPFRSLCFEQALATKFMLKRRGIPCTIYFGVAQSTDIALKAHSWTRVGDRYITGEKGRENYQIISTFS